MPLKSKVPTRLSKLEEGGTITKKVWCPELRKVVLRGLCLGVAKSPFLVSQHKPTRRRSKKRMFSDHTSAATEFPSSWRQTRSVKEGGCQTERQETREATAQSTFYDEAGTQTEERMAVRLNTKGLLSEFSPFPLRVPLPYSAIMGYGVHCAFRRVFLTFLNMHACIQPQNEGSPGSCRRRLPATKLSIHARIGPTRF